MTRVLERVGAGWASDPPFAKAVGGVVLAAAGVAAAALLADWAMQPQPSEFASLQPPGAKARDTAQGRLLHVSAALLSASVLADSAVEHYRGSFMNPGMYTPLAVSTLSLLAGVDGAGAGWLPRRVRDGVYGLAGAVGGAGFGFHVYNVLRKPGGANWQNLFYAAPLGAPAALTLAGALGRSADQVAATPDSTPVRLLGLPAGRALSALTSLGLFGTVGEVALLHFRGAFHNPFMYLPVSLPPVAAALMGKAALEPERLRQRPFTRVWLALTAALGLGGVGFHAYGVSRAMGGWRNWSQNVVDGPPLPAPPSFSALALAGLAALMLRDREDAA